MKLSSIFYVLSLSSLLLSCTGKEGKPTYKAKPALRISPIEVSSTRGTFLIEMLNAQDCHLLFKKRELARAELSEVLQEGEKTAAGRFEKFDLEPQTNYILYGVASDDKGQHSSIYELEFNTIEGPEILYDWEKARKEKASYSNMALCYGGSAHRVPFEWNQDRFAHHVSYTDKEGKEHWLFDAFLAIEFADSGYKMEYSIGYQGNAADKKSWTRLLDYWFDEENGFAALDRAVEETAKRIGPPPTKRKVVITLPDPIIHKISKDVNSETVYWGFLDGKAMDFGKAADRRTALKWYIDEARARWNRANYKNLEFIGFYIVSEDLATPGDGYSTELKHWEDIYPEMSKYVHACNETLNWIPYNSARGYQNWQKFGIDYAMMQPNYFWHSTYDMGAYMDKVRSAGLSMEFEFDSALLEKNSDSAPYRERFYKYMDMCKQMELYGKRELSYYFGQDDFYNISVSEYPLDQQLYHDLCNFIINSIH